MALTERQKNIINPYPQTIEGAKSFDWYGDLNNKFVLDAIHESYIHFLIFPNVGTQLLGRDREITAEDYAAYFALYPQNGKLQNDQVLTLSVDESKERFRDIVNNLRTNGVLDKYTSNTTEISRLPEYENDKDMAKLIAIPSNHSLQYRKQLRRSLALSEEIITDKTDTGKLLDFSPEVSVYIGSDSNVDLYDWRENCLPGQQQSRVYYNSVDKKYYFTRRTDSLRYQDYALGIARADQTAFRYSQEERQQQLSEEERQRQLTQSWNSLVNSGAGSAKQKYQEAYDNGIKEVLKLTGRYSEENVNLVKGRLGVPPSAVITYWDIRPGSKWCYAVKIPSFIIDSLPKTVSDDNQPSYEEDELSPLQKSQILLKTVEGDGPYNTTSFTADFKLDDLFRYMVSTRILLREYASKLFDEEVPPEVVANISLQDEIENTSSLFDMISEFYSYNKIGMEDDDLIEFCLSEGYGLDHMVINGNFYYRGAGNRTYLSPREEVAQTLSAFPAATPTTFSIVRNCYDMYLDSRETTTDTRPAPIDFLSQYLYPKVDKEKYKNFILNKSELQRTRLSRRKEIFTTLSRLSQTPPETFSELYSDRPLTYKVGSTLAGIDCNTGQMKAAKQALKFWQIATGKTKWRSLIREAILLLRAEIVDEAYTREALRLGAVGVDNPAKLRQEVETYVNSQIACSLDVVGDFIEKSVLDPLGAPPVANSLVRTTVQQPLKIKIDKAPMISAKSRSSTVYRTMIKTILTNFIKSLVAGVAKDLISALLGCGPEGNKSPSSSLANPMKKYDFGFSDLRDLVEEVDLVRLARGANLDKRPPDSPVEITRDQVLQFVKDASEMCTPMELERLLSGDASDKVLQHLLEVQANNSTHFQIPVSLIQNGNDLEEVVYEIISPRTYAHFSITKESLIEFYISLGDSLESLAAIGDLPFNSPLEAYCATKEQPIVRLRLDASVEDLDNQYFEIVGDKLQRIGNLCDWLRDALNIQLEMQRLIENLPFMGWYNDLLEFIAKLSNLFANWLAELWADSVSKPVNSHPIGKYNLYHTALGQEIIYQCFWALRNLPISELNVNSSGKPAFVTPPNYGGTYNLSDELNEDDPDEFANQVEARFNMSTGGQTANHIYEFIWHGGDVRAPGLGPTRLRFPQYRPAPQPVNETYDFSYYSLRTAPQALENSYSDVTGIDAPPIIPLGNAGARGPEERSFLSAVARKNFTYLSAQARGRGYTGHTWLRCDGGDSANIRIYYRFFQDGGYPKPMAYYTPLENLHRESSTMYNIGENGDLADVDYRIFSGLETPTVYSPTTTISVRDGHTLYVDNGDTELRLPRLAHEDVQRTYGNFSVGIASTMRQSISPDENNFSQRRASTEGEQLVSMNNYTVRTDETINISMFTDLGAKRFKKYVRAINEGPFKLSDEECITGEDRYKADSAVASIQTRMQVFFLNVMPLRTVYPNWGALGTARLISSYLTTKILDELDYDKELWGAWQESFAVIRLVYPNLDDDEYKNNPIIKDSFTPKENLRNIIEAMYISMLQKISDGTGNKLIRLSPFTQESDNYFRYRKTLGYFYRGMISGISPGAGPARETDHFGIAEADAAAVQALLRQCFVLENDEVSDVTDLGMLLGAYYFPIAFQVASYLMYYDYGLKYSERYRLTNQRLLVEMAGADDGLLTALKGNNVTKYSDRYIGFPAEVDSWDDREGSLLYTQRRDVQDRIAYLDQLPFTGWSGEFTLAYRDFFSDLGDYRFTAARMLETGLFGNELRSFYAQFRRPGAQRNLPTFISNLANNPSINLESNSTTKAFVSAYQANQIPRFREVFDLQGNSMEARAEDFISKWSAPDNVIYFSDSNYTAILEEKSNLESLINTNG